MKICNRCEERKALSLFAKDLRRPDGKRSHCLACAAEASRKWARENKEKANQRMTAWRDGNRDKLNATARARYSRDPERFLLAKREWKKENLHKVSAWQAKRRARRMNATPVWADAFLIAEVYDLAQRRTNHTGFKWHVDHVIPLNGRNVCGLHVEGNLQVIPWVENLKKGNKFTEQQECRRKQSI